MTRINLFSGDAYPNVVARMGAEIIRSLSQIRESSIQGSNDDVIAKEFLGKFGLPSLSVDVDKLHLERIGEATTTYSIPYSGELSLLNYAPSTGGYVQPSIQAYGSGGKLILEYRNVPNVAELDTRADKDARMIASIATTNSKKSEVHNSGVEMQIRQHLSTLRESIRQKEEAASKSRFK